MKEIVKLLKKVDLNSNTIYNKIIENKNSIIIKKEIDKKETTKKIKELVNIYDFIYQYKNIKIKILENEDILIKKI